MARVMKSHCCARLDESARVEGAHTAALATSVRLHYSCSASWRRAGALTLLSEKTHSVTSLHSSGSSLLVPRTTCSTNRAMEKMRFQWVLSREGCHSLSCEHEQEMGRGRGPRGSSEAPGLGGEQRVGQKDCGSEPSGHSSCLSALSPR